PSKLVRKVESVLEHLAKQKSSGATKDTLVQETGSTLIKVLGVAQPKAKHGLSVEQASMWTQLVKSLLQFPNAYWEPADAHIMFALTLTVDIGVASACSAPSDVDSLRSSTCELLEQILRGTPGIAAGLLEDAEGIVGHWAELTSAKPDWLAARARDLICRTTGTMAQASFGQSSKAADSTCRKLCTMFYNRFVGASDLDTGILVLEAFNTVALLAHQYAAKLAAHESGKKWSALLQPWISSTAQAIVSSLAAGDRQAEDMRLACSVGVYAALQRLHASFTDGEAHCDEVAKSTAALLGGELQVPRSLELALGVYAVHAPSAAGFDAAKVLAFLVRHLDSDSPKDASAQRVHRLVIAAIAGAACSESTPSFSDTVLSHVVEPLLKRLDDAAFAAALAAFLKTMQLGARAPAVCASVVQAFIRLAHKQDGSDSGVQRQRTVQRRVGTILTALHTFVSGCCNAGAAASALRIVNELVVVSGLRCTMNDVSESLAIVSALIAAPLRSANADELSDLYRLVCRCLGGIIRRHTGFILDSVSVVVAILRSLQHAFVSHAPLDPAGVGATPWIVASAPLPVRCAEAYSRVLNDL
ncbi:hypothetical protein GGF43_005924, partial [Coemansia sp. RSA 2618]